MDRKRFMYRTELKTEFAMTDAEIAGLGPPYKMIPNPHRRGAMSSIYLRQRVLAYLRDVRK